MKKIFIFVIFCTLSFGLSKVGYALNSRLDPHSMAKQAGKLAGEAGSVDHPEELSIPEELKLFPASMIRFNPSVNRYVIETKIILNGEPTDIIVDRAGEGNPLRLHEIENLSMIGKTSEFIVRALTREEHAVAFTVREKDSGKLLGYNLSYHREYHPKFRGDANPFYVSIESVGNRYQRKGLASLLLARLVFFAKYNGYDELRGIQQPGFGRDYGSAFRWTKFGGYVAKFGYHSDYDGVDYDLMFVGSKEQERQLLQIRAGNQQLELINQDPLGRERDEKLKGLLNEHPNLSFEDRISLTDANLRLFIQYLEDRFVKNQRGLNLLKSA